MKKFVISKIESPANSDNTVEKEVIQRLYDLGLHPGLEVEIVFKISFDSVTIIQFGATRLALNNEEFLCLHGR